jgi:lysozyme
VRLCVGLLAAGAISLAMLTSLQGVAPAAQLNGCAVTSGEPTGINVSQYQGTVDYPSVAAAGIAFVYARAADGTAVDPRYASNAAGAVSAGLAFGAYQQYEPSEDPIAQANALLDDANIAASDLVPALAVFSAGSLSGQALEKNLTTWLRHVRAALGVKPLILTDKSFWDSSAVPAGLAADGYPLWVSSPGAPSPAGAVPLEWSSLTPPWTLWMWSGSGAVPGVDGAVDEDRLNPAFDGGNLCSLTVSSDQTPRRQLAKAIAHCDRLRKSLRPRCIAAARRRYRLSN